MMCRSSNVLAAAAFFLFWPGLTAAGELEYTCRVSHLYRLQATGSLETSAESEMERQMKRNSFSISRETGAVIGKASTLDTSLAKSISVIHRGSAESSFEAVADFGTFKSGTHPYQVIKVKEYQKGSEKPFVALGDMEIITGTCK